MGQHSLPAMQQPPVAGHVSSHQLANSLITTSSHEMITSNDQYSVPGHGYRS